MGNRVTKQTILATQATLGFNEVFEQLTNFDIQWLCRFEEHLEGHIQLKGASIKSRDEESKVLQLRGRLPDESYETFEIIYAWLEETRHRPPDKSYEYSYDIQVPTKKINSVSPYADVRSNYSCDREQNWYHQEKTNTTKTAVEKEISYKLLKFALTGLQPKQRALYNKRSFVKLLSKRNLEIVPNSDMSICMSLHEATGQFIDKSALLSEVERCPIDRQQSGGYGGNSNSQFGGNNHSQEDEDPFLFYAASIYYQLHIHVISAVKGEEYVFYPSDLPSKWALCGHIFIAHLSGKKYCRLENVKENIPTSLPLSSNTMIAIDCGTIFTGFAILSNQYDILKCLKLNENVFCEKYGKTYPHRRSTKELINQSISSETNGSKRWLHIEDLTTDVVSRCVNQIKFEINQKFQGRLKNIQYIVALPIQSDTDTKMSFFKEIELKAKISRDSLSVVTTHEAAKYDFNPKVKFRYEYKDGGDVSVLRGAIQMIEDKKGKEEWLKKKFEKKLKEVAAKIELQEIKSFQEIIQKKHSYDLEGEVEVKPEILENGLGINTGDKLSFKEAVEDDIDKDTYDINKMVLSAKHGLWRKVWEKLEQKPYIVNCIPENSAWSALHQAIYLGNLEAVKKLVEDFEADPGCYTKPDIAKVAEPGTDAVSLAKTLHKNTIYDYLLKQLVIRNLAIKSQDINFVDHRNKTVYPFQKHPLLKITMASYKSIFSSDKYPCRNQMKHLSKITDGIFKASDALWKDAAVKIYHTLYGIDRGDMEDLLNFQSKEDFFRKLVRLYTGESIHHVLTPALSRQSKTPFKPLAIDLSVAPFALTLTAVLMYWEDIEPFGGVTYRGVSSNVVDKYKPGQTLMFLSFISSSKKLSEAKKFARDQGTVFIFYNTAHKTWQPRSIEKYSIFSYEEECLYPLGAEFSVDSVDKTKRKVTLTLLNSRV